MRGLRPVTEEEAPAAVRASIDACLSPDPAARPTAADAVAVLESIDDDGRLAVVREESGRLSVSEAVSRQAQK